MQQRRDDPQIAGDRRLAGQQRQDPLVDLQIATVDPVVVGDDHPGQLDVLVADRLQRAVELLEHQVHPAERLALELLQCFAELVTCLLHGLAGLLHYPNLPVT